MNGDVGDHKLSWFPTGHNVKVFMKFVKFYFNIHYRKPSTSIYIYELSNSVVFLRNNVQRDDIIKTHIFINISTRPTK